MSKLAQLQEEQKQLECQLRSIRNQLDRIEKEIALLKLESATWYVYGIPKLKGVAFSSLESLTQLVESQIVFVNKNQDYRGVTYFPSDKSGEDAHVWIRSSIDFELSGH